MLTISYFNILKRAHDHPKQRNVRFTRKEKIKILWQLVRQDKTVADFNKHLGLLFNSITTFKKQLLSGELGAGNEDLIKELSERLSRMRSKSAKQAA